MFEEEIAQSFFFKTAMKRMEKELAFKKEMNEDRGFDFSL